MDEAVGAWDLSFADFGFLFKKEGRHERIDLSARALEFISTKCTRVDRLRWNVR